MNPEDVHYDLIVTIVPKGLAEKPLRASQQAGAEGGTVLYGRGAGIHEKRKILGVPIEPEKEILLTAVPRVLTERVLAAIVEAAHLDAPGTGVAFVVALDKVAGICHSACVLEQGETPA
jgi:nitrogen regulatory protein PII